MMYAADFRAKARQALQNKWGKAVGVGFVAALLGAAITTAGSGGSGSGAGTGSTPPPGVEVGVVENEPYLGMMGLDLSNIDSITDLNGIIPTEYQVGFMVLLSVISFLTIVFAILHFTIGGAATLGYAKFNLNLVDHKSATFADLFSEFHRLWAGFMMQLLRRVYIFLWTLLFFFPGIYAAYGYAMAPYILAENPEMTANEAITKSKELMNGNRWRLFCLEISFIGWSLLTVLLTLGLGYLVLKPYMEASYAVFYREIKEEKYGREEQKEETYEGYYSGRIV